MGLFDRLLGSKSDTAGNTPAKPAKKEEAFFLDADSSSSMGNVEFMRRSNTIRRTFPGTVSSPGMKEIVDEVASMEARTERRSPGLPGTEEAMAEIEEDMISKYVEQSKTELDKEFLVKIGKKICEAQVS
jgi:hypothetical protein